MINFYMKKEPRINDVVKQASIINCNRHKISIWYTFFEILPPSPSPSKPFFMIVNSLIISALMVTGHWLY